jgi:hypothetical protein
MLSALKAEAQRLQHALFPQLSGHDPKVPRCAGEAADTVGELRDVLQQVRTPLSAVELAYRLFPNNTKYGSDVEGVRRKNFVVTCTMSRVRYGYLREVSHQTLTVRFHENRLHFDIPERLRWLGKRKGLTQLCLTAWCVRKGGGREGCPAGRGAPVQPRVKSVGGGYEVYVGRGSLLDKGQGTKEIGSVG